MDGTDVLAAMLSGLLPALASITHVFLRNAWWLVPSLALGVILRVPMPGRGPASTKRDPWRAFKYGARREVLARAGHRCEGSAFIAWGRCASAATEVDHVYPWSRGGPTVASNGQALCSAHNRSKGAWSVPWWYLKALESRRRSYFPTGADVRVRAVLSAEDRAARVMSRGRPTSARGSASRRG